VTNLQILHGIREYKKVKKHTCVPKLMKEAYSIKLDRGQATALIALLNDEWRDTFIVRPPYKLSKKYIKLVWHNKSNGNARAGYYISNRDDKILRPFIRLPITPTIGLVMHEFCHLVTVYHCMDVEREHDRNVARNRKRFSKHNWFFTVVLDYMLCLHKKDWRNIAE
jgi:hypothetical protein